MTHKPPQQSELMSGICVTDALGVCERSLERAGVFCGHGTDNPWDESVHLVFSALGLPLDSPAAVGERVLDAAEVERVEALLERRIRERTPLPYLTGEAWFAGLPFTCDERALVPRSPLAELVLDAFRPWYGGPGPLSILDLCCGGGAIGIAAAVHLPDVTVVLSDIDEDALALARANTRRHGVDARVELVCGNLFDALPGRRFDIILCNPPYVDAEDLASMPLEYRHEPPIGLGAGHDGLDLARQVLAQAESYLTERGLLLLEVGNSWAALERALPRVAFTWVELASGGHGVLAMQAHELRESADCLEYTVAEPG